MTQEMIEVEVAPEYHITTTVDNQVIGKPETPIGDPFISTRIPIGRRHLLKALFHSRPLLVKVTVGGNWDAIKHVMTVRPYLAVPPVAGDPTSSPT